MSPRAFWYFVSDYGDFASIAGLLVSLVGFGLTIWSAMGARRAAEQARRGVAEIEAQLSANELESCIQSIQTLLQELGKSHFPAALTLCVKAELGLSRISTSRELTSEESSRLVKATDDLTLIYKQIESLHREKEKGRQISEQAYSKLNDMVVTLGRTQARLKSQVRISSYDRSYR